MLVSVLVVLAGCVGFGCGDCVGCGVGVGGCVGTGVGNVGVGARWCICGYSVTYDHGCHMVVFGVGVSVAPSVELPYAEAAHIHRTSAAISVPHPRPILVLRERVLNQCLKPDGGFGG